MSKKLFALPADVELDLSGEKLSVRYSGDVRLEQTLGLELGDVECGGNLELALPKVGGTLRAGGRLEIDAKVEADTLHARHIKLTSKSITARAISADEKIEIGPATLQVDVIIAPEIVIDAKCKGRVTVIESKNEREATKIKGGFSLAEYEELFGDATSFLAERGVAPLGDWTPPAAAEEEEEEEEAEIEEEEEVEEEPEDEVEDDIELEPAEAAPAPPEEEEDIDDPLSLSIEDLTFVDEADEDTLYPQLSEAVGRIVGCYEGEEMPPAVTQLKQLVETRDYKGLRDNITEVWNGLLGFHQQRGIRPHHQVTHAFNVIHGLLQPA